MKKITVVLALLFSLIGPTANDKLKWIKETIIQPRVDIATAHIEVVVKAVDVARGATKPEEVFRTYQKSRRVS